MFENRFDALLARRAFLQRLAKTTAAGLAVICISLIAGMLGYHVFEGLGWLDAFLNASMLLGGMGPVDAPRAAGGKLFAGFYALYCGLAAIVIVGLILAPVVHRFLHKFHLEDRTTRSPEDRLPARQQANKQQ